MIRLQLRKHVHEGGLPSIRSFQLAFVRAGVNRPQHRRRAAVVVPQAVQPHEIWQVDAVENVPLATGQRSCWLTVTDEASGAILATEVPPHRRWEHVPAQAIQTMFRHVFTGWGLPDRVRVDNGYPWGTPRDLPSELALWLIGLAVEPIWNPPGQPTRNPKVEFHGPNFCRGARQFVRDHRPAGAAPSGMRARHTPVLAHQLASARKLFQRSARRLGHLNPKTHSV